MVDSDHVHVTYAGVILVFVFILTILYMLS
jgi:hypothetical protein